MYVYRLVLCDCVHGKGQHQLGLGKRSFKEGPFYRPCQQTLLPIHRWLSCSQLCSRMLRLVWRVSQDQSRPFCNWSLRESNRWSPTPQVGEVLSQKDPLQAVDLLLWLGAGRHWFRHRKYTASAQHRFTNLRSNLSKLRCHTLALQAMLRPHLYLSW